MDWTSGLEEGRGQRGRGQEGEGPRRGKAQDQANMVTCYALCYLV